MFRNIENKSSLQIVSGDSCKLVSKGSGIVSDSEIADLERKLKASPEDTALRAALYRLLIRSGQASKKSLQLAAGSGDKSA